MLRLSFSIELTFYVLVSIKSVAAQFSEKRKQTMMFLKTCGRQSNPIQVAKKPAMLSVTLFI